MATRAVVSAFRYLNFKSQSLLFALLVVYAVWLFYALGRLYYGAFGVDWRDTFYPATVLLMDGKNPYTVTTLHNPAWALLPLIPFAIFGSKAGWVLMFAVSFFAYVYAAKKLGASASSIVLFMASPVVIYNMMLGNIDWLVILGFVMPARIGLFFVLLKPQIGICAAMYWAYLEYKSGGVTKVARTFAPVTIAILVSFVLFGNWLGGRSDDVIGAWWNASFFPYSIPIGVALVLFRARIGGAISASPFLAPYLSMGSWSVAQLGFVDNDKITFAVTVGLWIGYFWLS